MLTMITVVGLISIAVAACKSIFTRPYDSGCIGDVYKFRQDVQNPNISPKQLDRNIRSGKYRKH